MRNLTRSHWSRASPATVYKASRTPVSISVFPPQGTPPTRLQSFKWHIMATLATIASIASIVGTFVSAGQLVAQLILARKQKKIRIDREAETAERRLLATVHQSRPQIYGQLQRGLGLIGTNFARGDGAFTSFIIRVLTCADIANTSLLGILSNMNQSLIQVIQGFVATGNVMLHPHNYHNWNAIGSNATRDTVKTLSQLMQRHMQAARVPRSLETPVRRRLEDIPYRKRSPNNDGSYYEGEWKEGVGAHGFGKWISADGLETYEGDFHDNVYSGYGTVEWARSCKRSDGQKSYTGTFQKGKIHGFGKAVYYDGGEYEGEYVLNLRDGYGKATFSNGDTYEGQYRQGQRHGHGAYISPAEKYEGEWVMGKKQGRGTRTRVDGLVYDGHWYDDEYHGYGIISSPHGWKYEGNWNLGKKDGFGHETWSSGDWREAVWSNDQITQIVKAGKTVWVNY